jgi:hypothetical protein
MESKTENFVLKRDGERNLSFTGQLIADYSDKGYNSSRWTDYRLYQTVGGKYIFESEYITLWQGEQDGHSAIVFDNIARLVKFLEDNYGMSDMVKEFAVSLGVDLSEKVD